jgi:hypothetical protein
LSEVLRLIQKCMLLGSDNTQVHKVLMNVNLMLYIMRYVSRHRLINRDINIRVLIEFSDKRILYDISEQSSEANEENCAAMPDAK